MAFREKIATNATRGNSSRACLAVWFPGVRNRKETESSQATHTTHPTSRLNKYHQLTKDQTINSLLVNTFLVGADFCISPFFTFSLLYIFPNDFCSYSAVYFCLHFWQITKRSLLTVHLPMRHPICRFYHRTLAKQSPNWALSLFFRL